MSLPSSFAGAGRGPALGGGSSAPTGAGKSGRGASGGGGGGDSQADLIVLRAKIEQRWRLFIDQTAPWTLSRWGGFFVLLALYLLRVYLLEGYYIVTYTLGIVLLNLLLGFLSPIADDSDNPVLPTQEADEYKPFSRRLPEFRCWHSATLATLTAFCCTFIGLFNIPVFWPILLLYFIVLCFVTMKRQVTHMIKFKYLPWSWGKPTYGPGHKGPVIIKNRQQGTSLLAQTPGPGGVGAPSGGGAIGAAGLGQVRGAGTAFSRSGAGAGVQQTGDFLSQHTQQHEQPQQGFGGAASGGGGAPVGSSAAPQRPLHIGSSMASQAGRRQFTAGPGYSAAPSLSSSLGARASGGGPKKS